MKNCDGNHTTPKTLAQQIIMDAVSAKMEFFSEDIELDHLTDRQKEQVYDQGQKLAKRIAKMLNYNEDGFNWS